ncbi:type VI secretion system lipoprotein TssJ [Malonomonas rubra]|uniref:type VI secretion system lipoprotein TssJ n=1 Tax=Malonomonas rubra TaxID=57040 RepID=UPI0026F2FDA3|nr:type VI secretion system lipoprotein TssJ [Malonomonas rubra]
MTSVAKLISLVGLLALLSACSGSAVAPVVAATFCEDCIRLEISADQQLNFHQGIPHSLKLCIYQLSDPNSFKQLTHDMNGLYDLLDCKRYDSSVKVAQQEFVHPGKHQNLTFDRAEGTRFVGIVAGYYNLRKEDIIRLYEIPTKRSFFSKIDTLRLFDQRLVLGSQQISE